MTPDRFIAWLQLLAVLLVAYGVYLAAMALWRIVAGRLLDLTYYEAEQSAIVAYDAWQRDGAGEWDDEMAEMVTEGQNNAD